MKTRSYPRAFIITGGVVGIVNVAFMLYFAGLRTCFVGFDD